MQPHSTLALVASAALILTAKAAPATIPVSHRFPNTTTALPSHHSIKASHQHTSVNATMSSMSALPKAPAVTSTKSLAATYTKHSDVMHTTLSIKTSTTSLAQAATFIKHQDVMHTTLSTKISTEPSTTASVTTAVASPTSTAICNGQQKYCDIKYSDLHQVGAHDSVFVGDSFQYNQHLTVTEQLDRGVRFLQAQIRDLDGEPALCHTSCFLAWAGGLDALFANVTTWLDAHPAEVVTVLIANPDGIASDKLAAAMTSSGLDKLAFAPGKTLAPAEWPTLGELITEGHRAVVFADRGADPHFPALLDEWAHFWETPFNLVDPGEMQACRMDRFGGDDAAAVVAEGRMYLVNHFLDTEMPVLNIKVPDVKAAPATNSPETLGATARACAAQYGGRAPKVMLLDFIDLGDGLAWERQANGVEAVVA